MRWTRMLAVLLVVTFRQAGAESSLEQNGLAYLQHDQLPAAEGVFLRLIADAPNQDAYWNILGVIHQRMGRANEAVSEFQKAIHLNPSSASAHYNLALSFLERKSAAEAATELEIAVKLKPTLAAAHYNLGTLYAEKGQLPHAARELAEAHRLEAANRETTYRLSEVEYHLGHYSAALETLTGPESAREFYLAGLCYSAIGKANLAIDNLGKAATLAPNNADYTYDFGIMLVNGQKDAEALQVFRKGAFRFPMVAKMHFGRGLAGYLNGQDEEAEAAMRRAIELDPRPVEMWSSLGDIYAGLGRKTDALAAYRKAQTLDPSASGLDRKQGIVLEEMNDLAAARAAFERALARDPSDSGAEYGLAKVLIHQKDFAQALRALERTVQMDQHNSAAYYQLALLYRKNNEVDKAEQALAAFKHLKSVSAAPAQ